MKCLGVGWKLLPTPLGDVLSLRYEFQLGYWLLSILTQKNKWKDVNYSVQWRLWCLCLMYKATRTCHVNRVHYDLPALKYFRNKTQVAWTKRNVHHCVGTSRPKYGILPPNLNNNWMTDLIFWYRHVTDWTTLYLVRVYRIPYCLGPPDWSVKILFVVQRVVCVKGPVKYAYICSQNNVNTLKEVEYIGMHRVGLYKPQ